MKGLIGHSDNHLFSDPSFLKKMLFLLHWINDCLFKIVIWLQNS